MKSLQESIFDDDLEKKEFTLRDMSCILAGTRGFSAHGAPIGYMFNVNRLKNYPNPYYQNLFSDSLSGLLGIIMDQPVPTRDRKNLDQWCDTLKKELKKYISRAWLSEFNDKLTINFYFDMPNKKYYTITFDKDIGEYVFCFKWNK